MTEPTSYDWEAAWAKLEPPAHAHPIQLNPKNFDNVAGYWVTNDLLQRSALWYASIGRPVFPCCPWDGAFLNYKGEPIDAKAPLVRNGWKDATTDTSRISQWWADFPYAMIGSPVPLDQIVLDFDPRNGPGDRWDLVELAGIQELPITPTVLSGRYDGGHHLFYITKRDATSLRSMRMWCGSWMINFARTLSSRRAGSRTGPTPVMLWSSRLALWSVFPTSPGRLARRQRIQCDPVSLAQACRG